MGTSLYLHPHGYITLSIPLLVYYYIDTLIDISFYLYSNQYTIMLRFVLTPLNTQSAAGIISLYIEIYIPVHFTYSYACIPVFMSLYPFTYIFIPTPVRLYPYHKTLIPIGS